MNQSDSTEHFVQELAKHQNRLLGYIFSLVGDHTRAQDILQETNLVLWRKIDEFHHDKPFLPWAFAIARYQVLADLRDRKRDRLLLDASLAEELSDRAEQKAGQLDSVASALRRCVEILTPKNRELIEKRYFQELSISELSNAVERTSDSVKVALLRARRQIAKCVSQRLAGGS